MIEENVKKILAELPQGVQLEAAAKTRTPDDIKRAIDAGVEIIGQNYIQEAELLFSEVGSLAKWHFIGHLQRNKVNKAVPIFDMIETVDSVRLAREIDKRAFKQGKVMSVLIEINSGKEEQKFGVMPGKAEGLIREISGFKSIKIQGLMTMGPFSGDPEDARPYFVITRKLFEQIKALKLVGVEMRFLSMGMTNSYRVALEEGANIVRIGTKIFGPR